MRIKNNKAQITINFISYFNKLHKLKPQFIKKITLFYYSCNYFVILRIFIRFRRIEKNINKIQDIYYNNNQIDNSAN